jgi:hypothetical protein
MESAWVPNNHGMEKEIWYVCTMDYYSAIKEKDV